MDPRKIKEIFNSAMKIVQERNIFGRKLEYSKNLEFAVRSVVSLSGSCDEKELRGMAESFDSATCAIIHGDVANGSKWLPETKKHRDYIKALLSDAGNIPDAFMITGEADLKHPYDDESESEISCTLHLRRNGTWTALEVKSDTIPNYATGEVVAERIADAFSIFCPDLKNILSEVVKKEKEKEDGRVILFVTVGEGAEQAKIVNDIFSLGSVGLRGLSSLPDWVLEASSPSVGGSGIKMNWNPDKLKKLHDVKMAAIAVGDDKYRFEVCNVDVEQGMGAASALAHLIPEIVCHHDSDVVVTGVAVGSGNRQMALSFAADRNGINYDVINAESNAEQLRERQQAGMRM